MAIKPQHLLRSLLLIPYIAWGIALLFALLVSGSAEGPNTPNAFLEALAGLASVYTIAIIGWGIPYTLLAVGLFLWSINKPAPTIYKAILYSPLLLSILIAVEIALISFSSQEILSSPDFPSFLSYLLLAIIPTLILGYIFVGVGIIIYKAMMRLNLIRTEIEPGQV
jgi:hypothetical protein